MQQYLFEIVNESLRIFALFFLTLIGKIHFPKRSLLHHCTRTVSVCRRDAQEMAGRKKLDTFKARSWTGHGTESEDVVNAAADGYTLLLASLGNAVNATLYENLDYNFIRDIAPIASISREPLGMEVNPSFPAKTVPEFIAYAKANPGKISMASAGTGNATHMAGELFKVMTHVDMTHIPYRGAGPAVTDLLGGQVQVYFGSAPAAIEHIRASRLRALAVTTATRFDQLPDAPHDEIGCEGEIARVSLVE